MKIDTTYSEEFDAVYNSFNSTEKGKKLLAIEGIDRRALDVGRLSHEYFTQNLTDMSLDANSNADEEISPNNYGAEIVKGIQKIEGEYLIHRYALKRFGVEYANELMRAIWSGDIYMHDASGVGIQQPYCFATSTSMIMIEGRPYGHLHSMPPKRADSFMAQCTEFVMDLSQAFCGAIAVSDLIPNYCYYAKKENRSDYDIINDFQKFAFIVNNKFRVGGQSPFCNISIFDMPNLMKLFEHSTYPDGSQMDFEYVMRVQKLFCEWFAKGDPETKLPYRFPIATINISCDENKNILDTDFLDWVSKVNLNTGCFNIYVNSGTKIASCCRLINDGSRMAARADAFGNGGSNIGSHRVVTINLPRIARHANGNTEVFNTKLNRCLEMARDLLLIHREEILERRIKAGFLRFYKPLRWFSMSQMFSTIGILGVYEMNKFMGFDIRKDDGQKFTSDILTAIEAFAIKTSDETSHSFNVEEIPGESVAIKFAEKDRIVFGDNPFVMYSNQFIPLIENATIPERIQITGKFSEIMSGGSILHIGLADQIKDPRIMRKLIEYAVNNGVAHFAISYSFGTCSNEHVTICGTATICPICGANIEKHLTRIVGYYTETTSWGTIRREYEFPNRKYTGLTDIQ